MSDTDPRKPLDVSVSELYGRDTTGASAGVVSASFPAGSGVSPSTAGHSQKLHSGSNAAVSSGTGPSPGLAAAYQDPRTASVPFGSAGLHALPAQMQPHYGVASSSSQPRSGPAVYSSSSSQPVQTVPLSSDSERPQMYYGGGGPQDYSISGSDPVHVRLQAGSRTPSHHGGDGSHRSDPALPGGMPHQLRSLFPSMLHAAGSESPSHRGRWVKQNPMVPEAPRGEVYAILDEGALEQAVLEYRHAMAQKIGVEVSELAGHGEAPPISVRFRPKSEMLIMTNKGVQLLDDFMKKGSARDLECPLVAHEGVGLDAEGRPDVTLLETAPNVWWVQQGDQ
eukprot:GHVU01203275.1.p1 GENE.GHVU01203275.1~~GHVU01203275.1.p1  ORF type:complete len:337 (+),score=33.52 GHVU01203275.1:188-1198(+)